MPKQLFSDDDAARLAHIDELWLALTLANRASPKDAKKIRDLEKRIRHEADAVRAKRDGQEKTL